MEKAKRMDSGLVLSVDAGGIRSLPTILLWPPGEQMQGGTTSVEAEWPGKMAEPAYPKKAENPIVIAR